MEVNTLLNANASVISVTTTATLVKDLMDTASGTANVFRPHLDAIDLYIEDGDVRVLYDGNTPTASKGILLKRGGYYRLRKTPVSMMRLISATGSTVTVDVQVGRSEAAEPSSASFTPYLLEQIAGEDLTNDVLKVEQRFSPSGVLTSDTTVKTGAGFVHTVTFSQNDAAPTAGTIDIYDGTSSSGTKIFTWTLTTAVFNPVTVTLDMSFSVGLFIDFTTTADVAVQASYR